MKKILCLLLFLSIYQVNFGMQKSVISKQNVNKQWKDYARATFQTTENWCAVTFKDESRRIKNIRFATNESLKKGVNSSEGIIQLTVKDYPQEPLFHNWIKSKQWKQSLYDPFYPARQLLATTDRVYRYEDIKKGLNFSFDDNVYFNDLSNVDKWGTTVASHNSPINTMAVIRVEKNDYLLSGSVYPSIKAYNLTDDTSVDCNGNQSYLLGANNDYIVYAYVNEGLSAFARWQNRDKLKECTIVVKKTGNFINNPNFKKVEKDEIVIVPAEDPNKSKNAAVRVYKDKFPLVVMTTASSYAVIYDPMYNCVNFISLASQKCFVINLKKDDQDKYVSYCSMAVITTEDFAHKVIAYLLPEEGGQSDGKFTLNKIEFDITALSTTETPVQFNQAKGLDNVIGISQWKGKDDDYFILCATSKGSVYAVNEVLPTARDVSTSDEED